MVHLLLSHALALECDVGPLLDQAETQMLTLESDAAQATLDQVEHDFGCGATSAGQVARFWLVSAGLARARGDQESVDEALAAARSIDASVWLEALGPDLRSAWQASTPPSATGTVVFEDLPDGYQVSVDGHPVQGRSVEVPAGFRVVQAASDERGWGRLIRVRPGVHAVVTTELPVLALPAPDPEPPPPEPRSQRTVGLHVGVGMRLQLGKRYETARITEPPAKVGPTVELGVRLDLAPLLLRAGLAADIPINGRLVFLDADGEARVLAVAPSVWGSAGLQLGDAVVGLHVAAMLPARLPIHLTGSYALTGRLAIEARLGGSIVGERTFVGDAFERSVGFEGGVVLLATLAL